MTDIHDVTAYPRKPLKWGFEITFNKYLWGDDSSRYCDAFTWGACTNDGTLEPMADEEIDIVKRAFGEIPTTRAELDKLAAFLRMHCNVPDPVELSRGEIVELLKIHLASKQTSSADSSGPDDGEWSKPLSKERMMNALGIQSLDTFNSFAERVGVKSINRKTHQIRIDTLSPNERERIRKA